MNTYILPLQDFDIRIKVLEPAIERAIRKRFKFSRVKKLDAKEELIVSFQSSKGLPSFTNKRKCKLIGKVIDDWGEILCFKQGKRIFYLVKNIGVLVTDFKQYDIYVINPDHWLYFIPVAVIIYYQQNKNLFSLHAGVFKYKKSTFLVVAKNGGGKTTFLLNLTAAEPEVDFLCDDLALIFPENGKIFCQPLMNGDKKEIKGKKVKNLSKKIDYRRFIYNNFKQLEVNKILFLNLTGKNKTTISKLKTAQAVKNLIECSILVPILAPQNLKTYQQTILKLVEQTDCFKINLGKDLKTYSNKYKQILNVIGI